MKLRMRFCIAGIFIAVSALLIAGCAVGPNYHQPGAPKASRYTEKPLPKSDGKLQRNGGDRQRFVMGRDIPGEWWKVFHSAGLNELIAHSLTNNPDLKAAEAALRVAGEGVLAQRGSYLPAITGGFSASRQKQSEQLAPFPNYPAVPNEFQYNLFTPEVSVAYVPDVFGLNRRTMESLNAQAEGVRFELIATYLTLSANVVEAAVQEATLRAQISATRQLVLINSNMVEILRYQYAKGYASRLDLAAQESQLAQTVAALPPLQNQLNQTRDLLAVLAGEFPSAGPKERFQLKDLHLPAELPLSLPSQLVEQRPDVRQAEANLHAASAQIGIAVANRLPNITLSANAGSSALAINQVFSSGTGFWGLGAAATTPIFEGGALLHQERAAKAAYVQAAEQYRSTVLAAFQNVADTLSALQQDGNSLEAARAAMNAAKVTHDLTGEQLRAGYASDLAMLGTEQAYQQARISFLQAQANQYSDTAALFQALGGGWWNRAEFNQDKHEK